MFPIPKETNPKKTARAVDTQVQQTDHCKRDADNFAGLLRDTKEKNAEKITAIPSREGKE